jgi:hypothetical protein
VGCLSLGTDILGTEVIGTFFGLKFGFWNLGLGALTGFPLGITVFGKLNCLGVVLT